MNDERIEFLVNSIASVCDVSDKKRLSVSTSESADVKEFLDDIKYVIYFIHFVIHAVRNSTSNDSTLLNFIAPALMPSKPHYRKMGAAVSLRILRSQ